MPDLEPSERRRVVVVGAGIAGLAAARALAVAPDPPHVVVLEASDQVGGKLRLGEVAGHQVDLGAESILNRRPEGVDLARDVGLGDDLVHPETIEARLWSRGELRPMPPLDHGGAGRPRAPGGAGLGRRGARRPA